MKKLAFSMLTAAALCLLAAGAATAATIGISPASQNVQVADSLTVDIVISNLGGEIVGAYDLDLTYDASILSATSVSFGLLLGNAALFEAFNDFDLSTSGIVDLAQLSLLSDAALLALQGGDSLVLATIGFGAVGNGTSTLGFVFDATNMVVGSRAQALAVGVQSGSVTVGGASAVPEPTAALGFALGFALMGAAVRRNASA